MPAKQRSIILYSRWMSYQVGAGLFFALAAAEMANQSPLDHEDLKFLSNACAFYFAGISGLYLLTGAVRFVNAISGRARRAIYRTSS